MDNALDLQVPQAQECIFKDSSDPTFNQKLTRAYRTPTEYSLFTKTGDSNNNNNDDVSYLHWILIMGPMCRIVYLLQEAFLEHADLTISFSLLFVQPLPLPPEHILGGWEVVQFRGESATL